MKKVQNIIDILKEKKLLSEETTESVSPHDSSPNHLVETPLSTVPESILSTPVTAITFDSRKVQSGGIFFCKGEHFKAEYLIMAKNKGALLYISETKYEIDLPCLLVSDIRLAMSSVAACFYDHPDQKLKLIGITGSKGKSTTVLYLKNILDQWLASLHKKPCGIISTIALYNGSESYEPTLTTPEALDIYGHLANAVASGLEYFVIEISSQALKYQRVAGLDFQIVCLLNLGRDHISPNEHPDYEDYIQSKLKIFDLGKTAVYNKEMDFVERAEKRIRDNQLKKISFSAENPGADYPAEKISTKAGRCRFDLFNQQYELQSIGLYNVENALCAIAVSEQLKVPQKFIRSALAQTVIPGRENLFYSSDHKIICFVSYAHNKLSFEKSFLTIKKNFPEYKIVAIFGASGSKGLNRIEDLPQIAGQFADSIYFVPDDPGYRKQQEIGREMAAHLPAGSPPYHIFDVREDAIRQAFSIAQDQVTPSLLFIAGKGEEHYQIIEGKPVPIRSDLEIAEELINAYNQGQSKH